MALANGKSIVKCREITLHTKTAIYIAEQFTSVRNIINYTLILYLHLFYINIYIFFARLNLISNN